LVTANDDHSLVANAWLLSSDGEILDSRIIRLSPGDNTTVNLSISSWDPSPGLTNVEVVIVDSNGITLHSSSSSHISRQSGWNIKVANLVVDDSYIDVGIDRQGYEIMEGAVCKVDIESEGGWSQSVAVDIYGSKYAPSVRVDRPSSVGDNAEVTAMVSCLAPWDIDDNPDDDTVTEFASKLPIVTYESGDIYWTAGISLLLVVLAYLGGILKLKQPEPEVEKKQKPETKVEKKPVVKEVVQVDDISLEDDSVTVVLQTEDEPVHVEEPEPEISVEEDAIDIDDGTASGRLSALKREIDTDSDGSAKSKDDISKRLDSFFSNR